MNELNKHKKSDRVKWVVVFVSIVLLAVALGGVMASVFTDKKPQDWFKPAEVTPTLYEAIKVGDNLSTMYIDTRYDITADDIARFKKEGKTVEVSSSNELGGYWLVHRHFELLSSSGPVIYDYGISYVEITSAMCVEMGLEIEDSFTLGGLCWTSANQGGFFWCDLLEGDISDATYKLIFEENKKLGFLTDSFVFHFDIVVDEIYCADILQCFLSKAEIGG